MHTTVTARLSLYLCGVLLLGGCAAKGPSYEQVMATVDPLTDDAVRLVLLRPRDADDGANGGAATIEVNQRHVGTLHYGGFVYTEVMSGAMDLTAFGHYRTFGTCVMTVSVEPGATLFVEVGPRLSYGVAGAVGGAIGGAAGAAAVPSVFGSVGAAIATGTAGMVAGSAAGATAATAVESRGSRCRGPYQLEILTEQDALPRLNGLTWSGD